MIDRLQLAAALRGLDARDREVLDLSLRRRVPDEALADMYGGEVSEVAHRRAAAIENLASRLDIQRGADLGHVLQALLEHETWDGVLDEPASTGETDAVAEPDALDADDELAESEPAPETPESAPAAEESTPVLEMLEERRSARAEDDRGRRRRRVTAVLAGVATILLPAAGIVAASTLNDDSDGADGRSAGQTRNFIPETKGPLAQPFASDPTAASGYPVARVRRATVLYDAPGGRPKVRIPPRTEWGSARFLGVVRQSGGWLAVQLPELRNGQVAWLEADRAELSTVPWSLHADLSKRELIVRKDGHFVRRIAVAIGSPNHPTPEGRFSITDKLNVTDPDSPYGCCVLATSGHQVRLPEGWPGGDRIAVHATSDTSSIGQAVSLGCMRAESRQVRWLIRTIPLGAPLFVRA